MSELSKKFKEAKTDQDKWELIFSSSEEFQIILDNDETYLDVGGDWLSFDSPIGDMDGIYSLLAAAGVDADCC